MKLTQYVVCLLLLPIAGVANAGPKSNCAAMKTGDRNASPKSGQDYVSAILRGNSAPKPNEAPGAVAEGRRRSNAG